MELLLYTTRYRFWLAAAFQQLWERSGVPKQGGNFYAELRAFLWTVGKLELVIYNLQREMLSTFSMENVVMSITDLGIRARTTEKMCR